MSNSIISQIIYENRRRMGMSQKDLGDRVGVSNRAVSKWEKSLSYPSTEICLKLSEVFGISLDALMNGETSHGRHWQANKGMESLKELFRIGRGPSSSHSMAPEKACIMFREENLTADSFRIILYGSLAKMGKGHRCDYVINRTFKTKNIEIVYDYDTKNIPHPTTMDCFAYKNGKQVDFWRVLSVGGGKFVIEGRHRRENTPVYQLNSFTEIAAYCRRNKMRLWQYVEMCEGEKIFDYLAEVWDTMQQAVRNGLETEGILPGGLGIRRKASDYMIRAKGYGSSVKSRGLVYAYALAVSEENACGGKIVTAPTCGSCGVMPAVLYHLKESRDFSDSRILRALATAGLFGNVVRTNASVSGAEVGCQGEVGVACAMAAGAASQLFGGTSAQIEYAAEMGLEHHLGLTCDPVCGLVQIPCIERNAFAAARALDANTFSNFSDGKHRVSFDQVVEVMRQTGNDLPSLYKETSEGGLAKHIEQA